MRTAFFFLVSHVCLFLCGTSGRVRLVHAFVFPFASVCVYLLCFFSSRSPLKFNAAYTHHHLLRTHTHEGKRPISYFRKCSFLWYHQLSFIELRKLRNCASHHNERGIRAIPSRFIWVGGLIWIRAYGT